MQYKLTKKVFYTRTSDSKYCLEDTNGKSHYISPKKFEQLLADKSFDIVNVELTPIGTIKYTPSDFTEGKLLSDKKITDRKYVIYKDFLFDSKLKKVGMINNADIVNILKLGAFIVNAKVEATDYDYAPYVGYNEKVTHYYKYNIKVLDLKDRGYFNGTFEVMNPSQFWEIIRKLNHEAPVTKENAKKLAAEIDVRFYLYNWLYMSNDQFSSFRATMYRYYKAIKEYEELAVTKKKYWKAIQSESDDSMILLQTIYNLMWLYGENFCKQFMQNPSSTVERYNVPLDEIKEMKMFIL